MSSSSYESLPVAVVYDGKEEAEVIDLQAPYDATLHSLEAEDTHHHGSVFTVPFAALSEHSPWSVKIVALLKRSIPIIITFFLGKMMLAASNIHKLVN